MVYFKGGQKWEMRKMNQKNQATRRKVICTVCGHDFWSQVKKPRCTKCRKSFVINEPSKKSQSNQLELKNINKNTQELQRRLDKLERDNKEINVSIDNSKISIAKLHKAILTIQHVVEPSHHILSTSLKEPFDVQIRLDNLETDIKQLNGILKAVISSLKKANIKILNVQAEYQTQNKITKLPVLDELQFDTTKSPNGKKFTHENIKKIKSPGGLNLEK